MKDLIFFILISLIYCSKNNGHLKKFGSQGPFVAVKETFEPLSTKIFFDNFVKTKTPILMRNEAKQFSAFNKWSDKYLHEKIMSNDENYKVNIETVKKESRDQQVERIEFTKFLDIYNKSDYYMVTSVPEFLKSDIQLPNVLQCEQASSTLQKTVLWFSSGGTKSVTHTDDYENILCLLSGRKNFILVDTYKYGDIVGNIIDVLDGSYSSMDVDRVDFKKYKGIENIEYYNIELNEGDCLYVPLRWIHQVDSFDRNLAVNFWFNYEKIFDSAVFSDDCLKHKFDHSLTLDKFEYETEDEDDQNFDSFRTFILRQLNSGKRKLEDWKAVLTKELGLERFQIDEMQLEEHVKEIFDLMDFDGDGIVNNDEIYDLDTNRYELIARVFEDYYSIIYKSLEEKAKNKQNEEL
jgi:hypothetical protein